MTLREAVDSGRAFRRRCWGKQYFRPHELYNKFDFLDAIADDYEVEEMKITISETQLDEAMNAAGSSQMFRRAVLTRLFGNTR